MLPALPTGMASTSGARPRSSQISKAAVFWPSRRNGLTELTSVTGWSSCSASARTIPSAWSKLPSMATTRAPAMSAWSSLPVGDLALRQDDDDLEPGGRAVRRGRGRGVAGRGAHDRPGARLGGLGDGHDHAPVLERAGRVLALHLEVQVGEAERVAQPTGADQRREPFAEGQGGRRVGDRQERPVALDEAGSGGPGACPRFGHRLSHRSGSGRRSRSRGRPRSDAPTSPAATRTAARRGPQVEPISRATAMRSPRTADEVAAPPAPGSVEADVAGRRGVDLDPVAHARRPAEGRVAGQRGRQDRRGQPVVLIPVGAGDQADDPAGLSRVRLVGQADGRDAGSRRPVDPVGPGRRSPPDPASGRTRAGPG